jgi:hypothetical protein
LVEDCSYVVDEYHASGHVGQWCSENVLPKLAVNAALLNGFPTNICETINSELSPLGRTVHHMGRWTCQLYMQEVVDVLNMTTLQKKADQSDLLGERPFAKRAWSSSSEIVDLQQQLLA